MTRRKRARLALLVAVLGGLWATGEQAVAKRGGQPPRLALAWVSSADGRQRLARLAPIEIRHGPEAGLVIHVDPARQYQKVEGFGAAITDSSAWLIQRSLSRKQRGALLQELFGLDRNKDLALGLTRISIGASDFSLTHYSYDDVPAGQTDPGLAKFSIAPAQTDLLPTLRQVRTINPSMRIFASPWSAPGWMKTSDSMTKGSLAPQYHDVFARYLVRTLSSFKAAGAPIYALTIQNEPSFEPHNYPGMLMSAGQRAAFIGQHLGPLMAKRHGKVRILDWDHNWDKPQEPLGVLADPVARKYVAGTAWHCYGGEPTAQSVVHDAFPEKETWFTECSGGGWTPGWGESLIWQTRKLIIGSSRNWAKGVILWNLALDQNNGPHLGGCGNCRGVVTIDKETGAVTRNVEYYVLGHASRFVLRGAYRVASDENVEGLETVAFRNPREGSLVLIVANTGKVDRAFSAVNGNEQISTSLAAGSVMTLTWQPTTPMRK